MSIDDIIKQSKKAENVLKKAKELDNKIHNVLSNIRELDIDKAESLINEYKKIISHAEGILSPPKITKPRLRSIKDYPDEKRLQIYQYLISQYFENKNTVIETRELASKFNIDNKSAGNYLMHNKGLKHIKKNKWEFKKDFLDVTLRHVVNMLLSEKQYLIAQDINKEHALSVGIALKNRYKDYGLQRKIAGGNVRKYFRK